MLKRSGTLRQIIDKRSVGNRAFTLVEVLVALTIGSLLVVSLVSATRALSNTRESVDRRIMRTSSARNALETIVAALRNVRRDPIRKKPAVIGYPGEPDTGDRINLQVISDSRSRPDGQESDQYEVSFYLNMLEDQQLPSLMCRKDHGLDDEHEQGGMATVVAENIVGLSFAYRRSDVEWVNEWSEFEPDAPKAVRVTVAAIDAGLQDMPVESDVTVLSTIVPIHSNKP
ncbi:MAG: PulJ/GspJ family protein, partial [Planctomycetota bacterium]